MTEDKAAPSVGERMVRAARSPLTEQASFYALWPSGDVRVDRAIAGNRGAPRNLLLSLSQYEFPDFMVFSALAGNVSTPPEAFEEIYSRTLANADRARNRVAHENWLWRMASNPATPDRILSILAKDIDPRIRLSVVGNPSATRTILNFLASDDIAPIRNAAAAVIATMGGEFQENILGEMAGHHLLGIIPHYAGAHYRPLSPAEFIELAADNDPLVREMLARRPDAPPDILNLLCIDKSINVVRGVAKNPSAPEHILDILSYSDDETVRFFVAIHQSTSRFTLARLISDQSPGVSTAAKTHTNTPWLQAPGATEPEEAEPSAPRCP